MISCFYTDWNFAHCFIGVKWLHDKFTNPKGQSWEVIWNRDCWPEDLDFMWFLEESLFNQLTGKKINQDFWILKNKGKKKVLKPEIHDTSPV